jgi:hypothetical protein
MASVAVSTTTTSNGRPDHGVRATLTASIECHLGLPIPMKEFGYLPGGAGGMTNLSMYSSSLVRFATRYAL